MTEPGNGEPEFVTVAEAAPLLGVSERTLRRALAEAQKNGGETAARIQAGRQAEHRQTKTGARVATVYPLALLRLFASVTLTDNNSGASDGGTAAKQRRNGGNALDAPVFPAGVSSDGDTAHGLAERAAVAEARAALLLETLERTRADLDHERRAHERAQTLHLNTQGELSELRRRAAELETQNARLIEALPVPLTLPTVGQEHPAAANGGPESGDSGQTEQVTARPFWARVWGKGRRR